MENKKVAIIGAGICGLYLAWKLSKNGHKVTVFEKKDAIGKKACSGLFSERILKFIPESRKLVQNEIKSALIHFPKRTLKIVFSKKFLVMSHFDLDNLAAGLAMASGAEIRLNCPIKAIPEGFERVIGCDGPDSAIRRILRLSEPDFRLGIMGFVQKADRSDFVETWPVKDGFIWKIPRGTEIEYGILSNLKEAKVIFNNFLKEKGIKLEGLEAGMIPSLFVLPSEKSITLCGDAAGLCKPWSGGGVVWGMIASEFLLKNFPDFLKYGKVVKRFFLPRIFFSRIFTKLGYFIGFNFPWILPKSIKIEGDFLF